MVRPALPGPLSKRRLQALTELHGVYHAYLAQIGSRISGIEDDIKSCSDLQIKADQQEQLQCMRRARAIAEKILRQIQGQIDAIEEDVEHSE